MNTPEKTKVICGQMSLAWEDRPANFEKVRTLLSADEPEAGSLLVLPEMFSTGFSMNVSTVQENQPPATENFLADLAREKSVHVIGGVVSPGSEGRGRNEAVAFGPEGERVSRYCKIHPFSFGGESEHYEAGSTIETFKWHDFIVAPFVCYDLRFPEVFRAATRRGATLLVVIANWPSRRVRHWLALLRARAIENQAYAVGVNRCGSDPKLEYPGRSVVVDPQGEIIADAGDSEGFLSAELDLGAVLSWRAEFPALQDIHPEYLGNG